MRAIGFIGAGNMAGALARGLLASGRYGPADLWASDPVAARRRRFTRRFGVAATTDNLSVVKGSRIVVLAVKPQTIDSVLEGIRPAVTARKLFVSIAAGVDTRRLERGLGGGARVVRVMPNTPALVGRGMAVVVRGRLARPADERAVVEMFRTAGDAIALGREALLDAVTGLSGSGPAYVYRFAEALIAGGRAAGLPGAVARRLAYRTLEGAAAMLQETGQHPARLRAMVTSPGGTTIAGLARLERGRFFELVCGAVEAAARRSKELGRGWQVPRRRAGGTSTPPRRSRR